MFRSGGTNEDRRFSRPALDRNTLAQRPLLARKTRPGIWGWGLVEVDDEKRLMRQAVDHFNRGDFFECHEFWEDLWHEEPPRERDFMQGLIQVAVGCEHFKRGNTRGAITLTTRGIEKLAKYPRRHRGIQVGQIQRDARDMLRALRLVQSGQAPREDVVLPSVEYDEHAYVSGHA